MENRVSINVGLTTAQWAYAEQMLAEFPKAIPRAMAAAVNEALRSSRTDLVRRVSEFLLAKKHQIRDPIYISEGAHMGNSGMHYEGVLTVAYRAIPIIDFKTRFGKRTGVTTQTMTNEPQQVFKHMFRQTMQSGHKGIFQRKAEEAKVVPTKGRYAWRTIKRGPRKGQLLRRQPIKESFGPAVTSVIEVSPELVSLAQKDMVENLEKSVARKIDWQLQKAGK